MLRRPKKGEKHSDGNTEHIPHRFHINSALYSQILQRFIPHSGSKTLPESLGGLANFHTHFRSSVIFVLLIQKHYRAHSFAVWFRFPCNLFIYMHSLFSIYSHWALPSLYTLTTKTLLTLSLSLLTVNGSDVYMNSCLYGNGTSFVESLFEDFGKWTFQSTPEMIHVVHCMPQHQ